MNIERYVIVAEHFNGCDVFAGYEDSSSGMPVWYEEENEHKAQEFLTAEAAKSWYNGAKKYLDAYYTENCYPYSATIQKRIIQYKYVEVESI